MGNFIGRSNKIQPDITHEFEEELIRRDLQEELPSGMDLMELFPIIPEAKAMPIPKSKPEPEPEPKSKPEPKSDPIPDHRHESIIIFMKTIGINNDYKYEDETKTKYFLRKNPNEITNPDAFKQLMNWGKNVSVKKMVTSIKGDDCLSLNWFNNVNNESNVKWWKEQYTSHYDSIRDRKCHTEVLDILSPNDLLCALDIKKGDCKSENKKFEQIKIPILGPSEITYPFVKRGYMALAINDLLHTEVANRVYIYCMVRRMVYQNIPIIICLSDKEKMGKMNDNEVDLKYIRFITKELYTLFETIHKLGFDSGSSVEMEKICCCSRDDGTKTFSIWAIHKKIIKEDITELLRRRTTAKLGDQIDRELEREANRK